MRGIALCAGFILTCLLVSTGEAATWGGSKGVNVRIGVVDESRSVDSDESDSTTTFGITPFVAFSTTGRVSTLSGRLGVSHERFSGNGGSTTSPELSLTSRTAFVQDNAWFDVQASAVNTRVSSEGFNGEEVLSDEQSTTNYQFQAGPQVRFNPAKNSVLDARAAIARTAARGDTDTDSTAYAVRSRLLSVVDRQGRVIGLDAQYQLTEFDERDDSTIGSASILALAPLTRQFDIYGVIGYDWFSLDADSSVNEELYGAGVRWRPSRNISVNAAYAERAFGSQPTVKLEVERKHSFFTVQWTRDLRINQLADLSFQSEISDTGVDEPIGPDSSDSGESDLSCIDNAIEGCQPIPTLVDAKSVEEIVAAQYSIRGRASTVTFSLSTSELTDLDNSDGARRNRFGVAISRNLSKNISATLSARISTTEQNVEEDTEDEERTVRSLGLSALWLL